MSIWGQLSFQDSSSYVITQLIIFHDHAIIILTLIITLVGCAILTLILNSFSARNIAEAQEIETIWTILPAIVLLFLTLPSLRLLYLIDEVSQPSLTIKTIGHQWYWRYEYSDFHSLEFDSYMLPEEGLQNGQFRLLEVDNRLIVPFNTEIRLLITAADVIHRWTIPSAGVKVDAIPGRLNQANINILYPGVFYGQCSEICGANHSFIPIVLESVPVNTFSNWLKAKCS